MAGEIRTYILFVPFSPSQRHSLIFELSASTATPKGVDIFLWYVSVGGWAVHIFLLLF